MLKYMGGLLLLAGLLAGGQVAAAQEPQVWSMALPELPQGVSASIAPLKYGKVWCYSVEMDDGGISALAMDRLLAELFYTDAPGGVAGGGKRRCVGGLALIGCGLARNNKSLSLEDIRRLQAAGWGVVNHGYWHTGCHWDLSKRPDRAQFDREVFWSQVVFGQLFFGDGRAPAHHVYPNGDYAYDESLRKYGIRSGSLVGGKRPVVGEEIDFYRVGRTYLDGGVWEKNGEGDPLWQYKPEPQPGELFLDFTHGINEDENSASYQRWKTRLETIAANHGAQGRDDVWAATAQEYIAYVELAKAAKVSVGGGALRVEYPAGLPGAALTVVLENLPEGAELAAPEGGLLYRRGTTAWLTTPLLGLPEVATPQRMRVAYAGEFKPEIKFETPVKFAGARVFQAGGGKKEDFAGVEVVAEVVGPAGEVVRIARNDRWVELGPQWGMWDMISRMPEGEAVECSVLRITPLPYYEQLEVWVLDE